MPLLLVALLVSGAFGQLAQAGFGAHVPVALAAGPGNGGKLNLFDPRSHARSVSHPHTQHTSAHTPAGPPQSLRRVGIIPMLPGILALTPGKAARFTGSDGRFEVDVPANAVTSADVAAAGGNLSLEISQIAPASGTNAGGTGIVSFGSYLLQLVDTRGVLVSHGLHAPMALKLHLGRQDSALDLSQVFVTFNGLLPDGTALAPITAPTPRQITSGRQQDLSDPTAPTMAESQFGAPNWQNATFDSTAQTLMVTTQLGTPSVAAAFNTNSPVATFGKPDPFNTDLNAGALSDSIAIDVPTGPGGLTPPVTLSYSSASVSEQHNVQAATGWTGEGWNLSLGAISWAEHNTLATCPTCGNGWEDSWQLSDPFGTAAELIPPNITEKTYYDDTANSITSGAVQWHAAPENHAKIYSYTGPLTLPDGGGAHPPCFRVFLTNGIMEEFGCTSDSLEYYYGTGNDYISNWNLDLITDPQGNQIHITYQQDTESKSGHSYIRDAVLKTIEWDSPNCHNAQSMCIGSSWSPLMRVNFVSGHGVTHVAGSSCSANGNLRCDDPIDLSGSGGLAAPDVQSTYVLNDVQVQVYNNSTWNTLRDYQLGYEQTPHEEDYAGTSVKIADPVTGKDESVAGELDLTQIIELGDDGTTALPTRTFGYTTVTQYYEDDAYHPVSSDNCGPSWNTGNSSGCLLWEESLPGNSRYLASASNGLGLAQTFSWDNGRNNTHGVPGGTSNNPNTPDPLYCNSHQSGYPCNEADDQNWSHAVLTQQQTQEYRAASSGNVLITGTASYQYDLTYPLAAQECPDCVAGMYWGNQNDGDYLDYYNGKYMGFTEADVTNPDDSVVKHHYYATEGYGLYDTSQVTCKAFTPPCHNSPWWGNTNRTDVGNSAHGHEFETDYYDTNGTTLLKKTTAQYQETCPPSGVSGTSSSPDYGNWNGNLVSELDHGDPVAVCDIQMTRTDEYTYDGGSGTVPQKTTTYSYDSYGRTTDVVTTSNGGGTLTNSATLIDQHTDYIWNDAVSVTSTSATGTYLIDFPNLTYVTGSQNLQNTPHSQCAFTSYDNQGWAGGQSGGLTLGETTKVDRFAFCGTPPNFGDASGQKETTAVYDTYGNQIAMTDPDGNAGDATHKGCTVNSTLYTACTAYDSAFHALVVSVTNAKAQSILTGYITTASGSFGIWPTSTTDPNGQTTTVGYDALGRMTSKTLPDVPGEPSGQGKTTWSYTDWCSGTAPQAPCVEVDQTQQVDGSTAITTRSFYDGYGNLAETRIPGPGYDAVRYAEYDPSERNIFASISYNTSSYTGGPGSAAFAAPDASEPGTSAGYDGLGRVISATDAYSKTTSTSYVVVTNWDGSGIGDEQKNVTDALSHRVYSIVDSLGRTIEDVRTSGTSGTGYTFYSGTTYSYDYAGNLTTITHPNGTSTTTFGYDAAGQQTSLNDPDRGSESYTYDANGNLTKSVDARGGAGTVYIGYDPLNRPVWHSVNAGGSSPYATWGYDSTAGGNNGKGRLTSETFNTGASFGAGSYTFAYDARGNRTIWDVTVDSANYSFSFSYNDAGQQTGITYADNELLSYTYNSADWLDSVTRTPSGGSAQNVVTGISYATYDRGGPAGLPTGATLGDGVNFGASHDADLRLTSLNFTHSGTTLFSSARTYDAVSNVTSVSTTLPTGTDTQAFCYDEQNRLTWAGTAGTPSCTPAVTPSTTLSGASYTYSYGYDTLDRITNGSLGAYTYGVANTHLDAVTAAGSNGSGGPYYTASYDAAGDMTCRAPSYLTTCSGTPTGQQLTYDTAGRLASWQNAPSSPTTTVTYAYDGEGQRIGQKVVSGGVTTRTYYLAGGLEEITGTTVSKYYAVPGIVTAVNVAGTVSYLASDGLGSVSTAFAGGSASVTASALYGPYGTFRYSSGGTMPTARGFTGQYADAATGLDYYGARYYDPAVGQFAQADTMLDGLNRYAYVGGNPETRIDPTGHMQDDVDPAAFEGGWANDGPGAPDCCGGMPNAWSGDSSNNSYWGDVQYTDAHGTVHDISPDGQSEWVTQKNGERILQDTNLDPDLPYGGMAGAPDETVQSRAEVAAAGGGGNSGGNGGGRRADRLSMLASLAKLVDQRQSNFGRELGKPAIAAAFISDASGAVVSPQFGPVLGTGRRNNTMHAEVQVLRAAALWIQGQVAAGYTGDITVDLLTGKEPCSPFCRPQLLDGVWLGGLQIAGQGNVNVILNVWLVGDGGKPILYSSQQ
jgi:RHS repeat-associated protein